MYNVNVYLIGSSVPIGLPVNQEEMDAIFNIVNTGEGTVFLGTNDDRPNAYLFQPDGIAAISFNERVA